MGKFLKNQSGFSAIEALLILVILGIVGFTGYFVWHTKQNTDKSLTPANSTTPVLKKKAASAVPSSSTKTQYVDIKELGIKVPITSALTSEGLSYTWNSTGNNATIGSSTLMSKAEADDAANCTQSYASQMNNLYPLGIVSKTNPGSVNASPTSISVSGTSYYLYKPHSGSGCDVSGTAAFSNDFNATYSNLVEAFRTATN